MASSKLAHIRAFTAAGFPLVPLCPVAAPHNHSRRPCRTPGKVPSVKNWETLKVGQFSEDELSRDGYGVILSAEDLVVDVDPRNFKSGDRPLARLIEKVGELSTFIVQTGGGGYHAYLKKPSAVAVMLTHPDFPGIEFKSVGGQVVGPGSTHLSGKEYAVASGTPSTIADASTALLALIEKEVQAFPETGTSGFVDDDGTTGRYMAYLTQVAAPSIEGQAGDANAYKVACQGRDLGLPPERALELMLEVWNPRCEPPWQEPELRAKVRHAYTYARGHVGSSQPATDFKPVEVEEFKWEFERAGRLKRSFHNLILVLRYPAFGLREVFAYNDFTGRVEFSSPAPWRKGQTGLKRVDDNDLKLLKAYLVEHHSLEMTIQTIEEAVLVTAYSRRFHPVREYLESLARDGEARLDAWLTRYLGAEDTPYIRACARKLLCAAVMRVMRPGCKFDHIVVLEGRQGVGKSSVCRILAGEWGADFAVDPHNKDTIQQMQGKWIIELAELEVTKRAERQALRAFITRTKDEARLAYGRTVGEFPRQSVFIGSINPSGDGSYLRDDENRRWWPVACGEAQFDLPGLKEARNQLFAEAMNLVKTKGEALFLDTLDLQAEHRLEAAKRRAEYPWLVKVARWLSEVQKFPATRYDRLTARDVYVHALDGSDRDLSGWKIDDIGRVLAELGWVVGKTRGPQRGWVQGEKLIKDTLGDLA